MTSHPPLNGPAPEEPLESEPETTSGVRNFIEWVLVIAGAVLLALFIRTYFYQSFYIPSESMETTLLIDDRVMVNKFTYDPDDIERGDVIVFNRPPELAAGQFDQLIKRVIAVEGDTVEGRGDQIFINGEPIDEPHVDPGVITSDFAEVTIEEDKIWVMGDNRSRSQDSRFFGQIEVDSVVGKAMFTYWPLNRIGGL